MSKSPKPEVPVTQRWEYSFIPIILVVALAAAGLGPACAQGHTSAVPRTSVHCLSVTANDFAGVLGGIDAASISATPNTGPEATDFGRRDCQMRTMFQTIEVARWDDPTGAKFSQLQSRAHSTPMWIPSVDPSVQGFCYGRSMQDSLFGETTAYTCDLRKGTEDLEVRGLTSSPPMGQEQLIALLKAGAAGM